MTYRDSAELEAMRAELEELRFLVSKLDTHCKTCKHSGYDADRKLVQPTPCPDYKEKFKDVTVNRHLYERDYFLIVMQVLLAIGWVVVIVCLVLGLWQACSPILNGLELR